MAVFPPETLRILPLLPLLVAVATTALGAADSVIDIDAGSLQVDTGANRLLLRPVEIRQGGMTIRADEAWVNGVELNFSNSEWQFRGAVHIVFDGGELNADNATARFITNRLQSAQVTGAPARFSHQATGAAEPSHGQADTINYDVRQARVRLEGQVQFFDGRGEFATRAPLTYNLSDRSVSSERVQITIRPEAVAPALQDAQP